MDYNNLPLILRELLEREIKNSSETNSFDIDSICQGLEMDNPISVIKEYSSFNIDPSFVLTSFGQIYGEDWIFEYMSAHKEEIAQYLR